jgi:hypothetical protein
LVLSTFTTIPHINPCPSTRTKPSPPNPSLLTGDANTLVENGGEIGSGGSDTELQA